MLHGVLYNTIVISYKCPLFSVHYNYYVLCFQVVWEVVRSFDQNQEQIDFHCNWMPGKKLHIADRSLLR